MKLIIDIEKDYYEMLKYDVEHGQDFKPFKIIANGKPYEERPHGEWLEGAYLSLICSNCKEEALDSNGYPYNSNFCPNCGAIMNKVVKKNDYRKTY